MRKKDLLFSTLMLLLAVSCESDDSPSIMIDNPFLNFEVTTASGVVSGEIDAESNMINISGITSGYQILSVDYTLAEGVTIYPDPADRIGVWQSTENYLLTYNGAKSTYKSKLLDYITPRVISDGQIYPYKPYGCVTEHHLYDLKDNEGTVGTYSNATAFFQTQDMDGIRIPIWAGYSSDADPTTACAHPSAGVINESVYANFVARINNCKTARGGNDFKVMASIKSNWGEVSYPAWITSDNKANGTVDQAKYAVMIFDFIKYMKEATGITVDVLGPYNEGVCLNGAGTYAASVKTLVNTLYPLLDAAGLPRPQIIGPDPYLGDNNTHATQISTLLGYGDNGYGDYYMQKVGMHYYSADGHSEIYDHFYNTVTYATLSNAKCKFWATEPHWNTSVAYTTEGGLEVNGDLMVNAERAITCLWTHSDLGMEALCWWDYPTPTSEALRSQLMRAVSLPVHGARPILVEDHDDLYEDNFGSTDALYTALLNSAPYSTLAALDVSDYNEYENSDTIFTRAFIEGKSVSLFIINVAMFDQYEQICPEFAGYRFEVVDATVNGTVKYEQWTGDNTATGFTYYTTKIAATAESLITIPVPKRSITHVTFSIEPKSDE